MKCADNESVKFSEDLAMHQNTVDELEKQIKQFSLIPANEEPLRIQSRQFEV